MPQPDPAPPPAPERPLSSHPGPRAPHRPGGPDDGSGTLEFVILIPVLLLVLFGITQGAFWYHARNLALAAATEGLQTARTEQGTPAKGEQAATSFLARAGGLDTSTVAIDKTPTTVTVTVTGTAPSILPGLMNLSVSQTATGPVERFTGGTP
jgi:Flp pilus assembly protein TadG